MADEALSSAEALKIITDELSGLLEWYKAQRSLKQIIAASFSVRSDLPWPYVLLTLAVFFAFIFSTVISTWFCSLLLLSLLMLNTFAALWHAHKKQDEILARIRWCIEGIQDVCDSADEDTDCLHLSELRQSMYSCETCSITDSPSHSIAYVFRKNIDSERHEGPTPLPTALLATGDVIALWSGQESPARIECAEDSCCVLNVGDVLTLNSLSDCVMSSENPHSEEHRFRVLESPILEELRKCLAASIPNSDARHPPPILFKRQRHCLLIAFLRLVIPFVLVVTYVTSAARYLLLPRYSVIGMNITSPNESDIVITPMDNLEVEWYVAFVKLPAMVVMPFLPVLLPALLILLLTVGEAKTLSVAGQGGYSKANLHLTTPFSMSSQAIFLESQTNKNHDWRQLFTRLLWKCDGTMLPRNAGLFESLGSLTVLCCIDKEGILSWFNPVTEKVFFFHHERKRRESQKVQDDEFNQSLLDGNMFPLYEAEDEEADCVDDGDVHTVTEQASFEENSLVSETLTLSQDSSDPSKIHFDDVKWEEYLPSLKPIGLNILLGLCVCSLDRDAFHWSDSGSSLSSGIIEKLNQKEFLEGDEDRGRLYSELHVREQKMQSVSYVADCLSPKTNIVRLGLCSLAELLGFLQNVKIGYSDKQCFTGFKTTFSGGFRTPRPSYLKCEDLDTRDPSTAHAPSTFTRRNKWNTHLSYLHGLVVQDMFGDEQVLVYGSGDVIMEHCTEAWNGKELTPISVQDRKKAVDFYQRSSVAGHCVAFAFMPLVDPLDGDGTGITVEGDRVWIDLAKDKLGKGLKIPESSDGLDHLIFLGMTTLQFQARMSVCQMVDTLDRACIRFVHFSADNEVRSRVFAEKMGLETGWNCHISLGAAPDESSHHRGRLKSESTKSRTSSEGGPNKQRATADEDDGEDVGSPSSHLLEHFSPRTQSESSASDSLFNVSNRAKLPRGIENIVPHIENVDNVPLLVPLFTDATPETTHDMIQIMQDYGEVVCCVGSSDCIRNISVFNQANISLSLEPLVQPNQYRAPTGRSKSPDSRESYEKESPSRSSDVSNAVAMKLVRKLHMFPCPLLLSGDNSLSTVNAMISQARHFLFVLRISFVFLVKCQTSLALYQLFAHIMLLPAPLTPVDIFWLSFVILPVLSFSLLGSPPDSELMTWANQKTLPKDSPVTLFMLRQSTKRFVVKFLPSVVALATLYALCLHSSCLSMQGFFDYDTGGNYSVSGASIVTSRIGNNTISVRCYPVFQLSVIISNSTKESVNYSLWDISPQMSNKKRAIQLTLSCLLVLYACVVSVGYVHRWKRLTSRPLCLNKLWCVAVPAIICCQVVGSIIAYVALDEKLLGVEESLVPRFNAEYSALDFGPFQNAIWSIMLVWPLPCLVINELWKWREIKMWDRGQKRARLDFGTKLGMNSPF